MTAFIHYDQDLSVCYCCGLALMLLRWCICCRRQALDRGGLLERADKIATGHNADDIAETILLNIIRGDVPRWAACRPSLFTQHTPATTTTCQRPTPTALTLPRQPDDISSSMTPASCADDICRFLTPPLLTLPLSPPPPLPSPTSPRLSRCVNIVTGGEGGPLPRVKPFKYTYEKEIVMYAYFKRLDYFSTECVYAPFAARGLARDFVKDLEVRGSGMHGWLKRARQGRSLSGDGCRRRCDGVCTLSLGGSSCVD